MTNNQKTESTKTQAIFHLQQHLTCNKGHYIRQLTTNKNKNQTQIGYRH